MQFSNRMLLMQIEFPTIVDFYADTKKSWMYEAEGIE
jgi:hypothetical protein